MATDHDFDATRDAYERVQSIIEHNTLNDKQPPAMRAQSLFTIVQASNLSVTAAEPALRKAVSDGAVVKFTDHEGTVRYTLAAEDRLVATIEWLTARTADPPRGTIGDLSAALQEVRADD